MIELGQLERRHADFASKNLRVIVVSMESVDAARQTQQKFPHLLVIADAGRGLSEAADVVQAGEAPSGDDADVPTTILVDRHGMVRWLYRSPKVIVRLSPDDVLAAVRQNMPE